MVLPDNSSGAFISEFYCLRLTSMDETIGEALYHKHLPACTRGAVPTLWQVHVASTAVP